MRLRPADLLHFAALVCMLPMAAQGRESDRQQAMSIEADDIDATLADDSESKLTGNVAIAQGSLRISAGTATITRKGGDITRALLEGGPATMQQENDNGAMMKAQANRIVYDVGNETVELSGNAAVDQAGDSMRGERIVYDLKNGRLNAAGEGSNGRIRMTIQPKPAQPEPATPAAAPAGKEEGGTP